MKRLISSIKHQRDIKIIRESGLFDEHYYVTHNPETLNSRLAPLEHYVRIGSSAGMRPNPFFDDAYYRDTNPDVRRVKTNPLVHYIRFGAREGRNPSRIFNTKLYLQKHPDVAETGVNPLWHFLTYGAAEQRELDNARLEALSPENKKLYAELVHIDPLLPPFEDLKYVPLVRHPSESLAGRAYFKLAASVQSKFSHLLVLQRLMRGGAATLSMYFAELIKQRRGAESVFVLLTDLPDDSARHLLPAGVTMVVLDQLQPGLSEEEKVQVLARFIVETQPQVVHNIDSKICWEAYKRYHSQFHASSRLVASLFMFTYNEEGAKAGYASDYLNSCIDNLDLVLVDNQKFKDEACDLYALEKHNLDKLVVIYTPILSEFHEPELNGATHKRVLWTSRLHPDKRPDLLAEIAQQMPDFTFEIYGSCALEEPELSALTGLSNINLHGPYSNSRDLPREGIGVYLHTTKHEGGAITMKEAIAAGLPAVAPALGLIPAIVTPDTGWLITDTENATKYVEAIRNCLSDPAERVRRIRNAQQLLKQEHSWKNFERMVSGCESYKLVR